MTGAVDKFTCISGKANTRNVLTKRDRPLAETLQLTVFSGKLPVDLNDVALIKSSEGNFG